MVERIKFSLAAPVVAIVVSILVGSLVLIASGANPLAAYGEMIRFGFQLETIVNILNRATPLYLSAVAVAIGFRMNLFNIGVEGQYILAAFMGAAAGAELAFLPGPLHVVAILFVSMVTGAVWAAIPAVLKVTRGVSEVISTIMLNAIATGFLVSYLLAKWADQSDTTLNIQTKPIEESGWVPSLNGVLELFTRDIRPGTELYGFLLIAILVGVIYHVGLKYTRPGFDLRASGENPAAAEASGVSPKSTVIAAMLLSGGIAGLVGLPEILGRTHNFGLQFTRQLGFVGIAVALLGRNHPVGIAVGALIIAFLDSSSAVLQVKSDASPEVVKIIQGVIIFTSVVAYEVIRRRQAVDEARSAAEALAQPSPHGSHGEGAEPMVDPAKQGGRS